METKNPIRAESDGTLHIDPDKLEEETPYSLRIRGRDFEVVKTLDGAIEVYGLKNSRSVLLLAAIATVAVVVVWILRPWQNSKQPEKASGRSG